MGEEQVVEALGETFETETGAAGSGLAEDSVVDWLVETVGAETTVETAMR